MSDSYAGQEPISTEVAPEGTTTGEEQTTDQLETPAREYLDLDEVADRYVKVTVDGEELDVPISELRNGYSRQADYTRKTQELAAQREQAQYGVTLMKALQSAPEETIRLLARQHGLTLAEQQQLRDQAEQLQPEDEFQDPYERRVVQLERRLQEREQQELQARADAQLRGAIGGLQSRYQADEATVREVVQTALQMNAGPEAFDMIYRGIMFDRTQQQQRQAQQRRVTEDQQRQTAAQQASVATGAGPSASGAGAPPPVKKEFRNYREAIEASFDELGVR